MPLYDGKTIMGRHLFMVAMARAWYSSLTQKTARMKNGGAAEAPLRRQPRDVCPSAPAKQVRPSCRPLRTTMLGKEETL